jgi:hypothetical protein
MLIARSAPRTPDDTLSRLTLSAGLAPDACGAAAREHAGDGRARGDLRGASATNPLALGVLANICAVPTLLAHRVSKWRPRV